MVLLARTSVMQSRAFFVVSMTVWNELPWSCDSSPGIPLNRSTVASVVFAGAESRAPLSRTLAGRYTNPPND